MRSVLPGRRHVNGHTLTEGAMANAYSHLMTCIGEELGEGSLSAADHVLGWAPYVRRGRVPYSIEQRRACPKCRRVQSRHFSRNGSRQRRTIFRDFVASFQAQQRSTVLRRALRVVQKYRTSQPEAVTTLRRDFRATITCFWLQESHPTCGRQFLRTPVVSNASTGPCGAVSAAATLIIPTPVSRR